MVAASIKEDHRYADTFSWHRLGQDDFSPCGARRSWQGAGEEEVHTEAASSIRREPADVADRFGSLFRSALSLSGIAEARPRRSVDPSPVREAFREVQQERFQKYAKSSNGTAGRDASGAKAIPTEFSGAEVEFREAAIGRSRYYQIEPVTTSLPFGNLLKNATLFADRSFPWHCICLLNSP